MTTIDSKSQRKPLLFWGWGYADEKLSDEENRLIEGLIKLLVPKGAVELPAPQVDEFELADSRLKNLPPALQEMVSLTAYDRLVHSYGKSYPDMARMYLRHAPNAPDGVAFPKTEQDIQAIY